MGTIAKELPPATAWYLREEMERYVRERGVSYQEFAELAKVTKGAISDLHRSVRTVGLKTGMGIARVIGVAWEEIDAIAARAYREAGLGDPDDAGGVKRPRDPTALGNHRDWQTMREEFLRRHGDEFDAEFVDRFLAESSFGMGLQEFVPQSSLYNFAQGIRAALEAKARRQAEKRGEKK